MSYKRLVTLYKSHSHQNAGAPPPPPAGVYLLALAADEKNCPYIFFGLRKVADLKGERNWKNGERGRRGTDEHGDDEGQGRRQGGVTGRESLRNTPNKAARGEGGGSNLCLTRGEEGGESLDLTAHTHSHTVSCTHTHTHRRVSMQTTWPCRAVRWEDVRERATPLCEALLCDT